LKLFLAIASFFVFSSTVLSQTDSLGKKKPDTAAKAKPAAKPPVKVVAPPKDTLIAKVDTTLKVDSLTIALADSLRQDSIKKATVVQVKSVQPQIDTSTYAAIMYHPFIPFNKPPLYQVSKERNSNSNDGLFYLLVGVVALIGFIRVSFPKYFQNLFSLFFQTSFRQKQTRDQLLQDNLASLLMNLLFIISGSIFIALIAQRQNWINLDFWWLLLYCAAILGCIYLVKYLFLLFSGWVFNEKEAAGTYLFVVFLSNKIIGIMLVPFVLILAFSSMVLAEVAITVSLLIVGGMFLYRYVASLGTIRTSLKVNALHFFLYLCAVEVLPLLLMYKVLFNFIRHYP